MKTTKEQVLQNLREARRKGWWIACFYWERQLDKLELNSKHHAKQRLLRSVNDKY